jgi:DNA-binding response OmpR family regulator
MKRVLVIDDDVEILGLIKCLLEEAGYKTIVTTNGKKGLEIQRKTPADLIITDIFMPEKEGTGVLIDVRDEFPQTKVIVMSGGGHGEHVDFLELATLLGANKVFRKPFNMQDLMNTVKSLI